MATVHDQIRSADESICKNIDLLPDHRPLLSQNILAQIRNLIEGVAVYFYTDSPATEFTYREVRPALNFAKNDKKFSFIEKFHKMTQSGTSHYTLDGDASVRLMLKYYEYLLRTRNLLRDEFSISVLSNLEKFPVDLDPSLREYHKKIAYKIEAHSPSSQGALKQDRYYIHKTRPFFVGDRIYYEVTFYRAINKVNKFDRIIAFTDIDMTANYAAYLSLQSDNIEVLGKEMPITIILKWGVSIRPCEFNNFARLLGIRLEVRTGETEYVRLMQWLTASSGSLLDIADMTTVRYAEFREYLTKNAGKPSISPVFDKVRRIVRDAAPGHNVLRYLLLRMYNQILKPQYHQDRCHRLTNLNLLYGCIPFDTMPFCTSLPGHNPRFWDLIQSIDVSGRKHELLARRVKNNVERNGVLYSSVDDFEDFERVNALISSHNTQLYFKHKDRSLVLDKNHVFINRYEDDTVSIVKTLQRYASSGIAGYTHAVEHWLKQPNLSIDDPLKVDALKKLFANSHIALIYGAAGTGKSTLLDHIAHYFNDASKLFLAHTNPAIDNLRRKVNAQNSNFRTIRSHEYKCTSDEQYDLLIIDECSTVSNADLIQVLDQTSFKLLILVGDEFQIESIQFGNWFGLVRSFIPSTSVFELKTPYRTKNKSLLEFWDRVRTIKDDIAEAIARNGYSAMLDKTLFEPQGDDEIILCLNYDGLYGINNINRFLQSSNPCVAISWRESTYKIGDPILFFETERFRPVIYNNLKGRIMAIDRRDKQIQFDVELDRPLHEFHVYGSELEWVNGSIVRFTVYDFDNSDIDDDSLNTTVPFQVAYAVSIHKAQGLEYDSVKIVITDANEEDITHSIFYTAVTRARESLRIFWTPETQKAVLSSLKRITNRKDVALLTNRRDVKQDKRTG